MIDFVLLRKNPVLWISCSSTLGSAAAKSRAVRYFVKRAGVTMFTRASVDCADRIVATSRSSGFNRQGVVDPVNDDGPRGLAFGKGAAEPIPQVVVAEALPHRLLGPGHDAERRELLGTARVLEIARDR